MCQIFRVKSLEGGPWPNIFLFVVPYYLMLPQIPNSGTAYGEREQFKVLVGVSISVLASVY